MDAARSRRSGTAALAATAMFAATACGVADAGEKSVTKKDSIVIGVNPDQPSVGSLVGKSYEGFDIDVAREVARRLGITGKNLTFRPVTSKTRESMLRAGKVDLVVASYSVTPERKVQVAFAGPYYVAHQDILVRASDTTIKNVHDLQGKRLCQVQGSVSFQRVHDEKGVSALPVAATGWGDCLSRLSAGKLDAVSTDDLILAGWFASQAASKGNTLKIVKAPFSDEPYGIGIRKGDLDGCEAINKAITGMYQDGTATRLLYKWFGPVGISITRTIPQFEGCD